MTMNYGLTPAEQAAQRAAQRSGTAMSSGLGMNMGLSPSSRLEIQSRSPIASIPPAGRLPTRPYTAENVRFGDVKITPARPVPMPTPNIIPDLRFPNARPIPLPQPNIIPDSRFPNARPIPLPTPPYTPRGPMTGPLTPRGWWGDKDLLPQFHNYMLSPSRAGGAFEPNIPRQTAYPFGVRFKWHN